MDQTHNNNKLGLSKNPFVLMPILLLMWGSLAAVSKLLLHRLDSYQLLFYMYGIGVAVFGLLLIGKVRMREIRSWRFNEVMLLLLCGALTFLYDFFYLKSLELIPAIEASMLNYFFPIFIVLFAVFINHEKFTVYKLLSAGMGLLGTVLLITKGNLSSVSFTNLHGDVYAVLAAVSWGLFTNLVKKNKLNMLLSTFTITFVAFLFSLLALLGYSQIAWTSTVDMYGVIWLSMSNIVFGFFLYFRALQYSSASLIASFTFFTPFITLLFIVVLLGERLTLMDCAAAVLILCSVPVQSWGEARSERKRSGEN